MDGGTANLDGNNGVKDPDGRLERLEVLVLVREHAEVPIVHSKADTSVDILLGRLEPRISLGLDERRMVSMGARTRRGAA